MTSVSGWTCPACKRLFARQRQGHDCAPAMTVEEYFAADGPAHERPIFDEVWGFIRTLGEVHLEPVSVGMFFKRPERFAQLRTMSKWCGLSFSLRRVVSHRCIVRKPIEHGGRWHHVVNLRVPEDFDDDVRGWVEEAYNESVLR